MTPVAGLLKNQSTDPAGRPFDGFAGEWWTRDVEIDEARRRKSSRDKKYLVGWLCLLCLPGVAGGTDIPDALSKIEASRQNTLNALNAELQRSVKELKAEDFEAPYFISYPFVERESVKVGARFGALLEDAHNLKREVAVDVLLDPMHSIVGWTPMMAIMAGWAHSRPVAACH